MKPMLAQNLKNYHSQPIIKFTICNSGAPNGIAPVKINQNFDSSPTHSINYSQPAIIRFAWYFYTVYLDVDLFLIYK